MAIIFPLLILIFLSVVIAFGGPLLRRILAKDHPLQRHLSDDAINRALAWVARNKGKIAGWLLITTFTILTLVYS
jgi:hypothetical protein